MLIFHLNVVYILLYLDNPVFNPVVGLSFEYSHYSLLLGSYSNIPFSVRSGLIEQCNVAVNDLPSDLGIKTSIYGVATVEQDYKEYKISCKNSYSVTNPITIYIRVSRSTLKGITAYYMKPALFDTTLNTVYDRSSPNCRVSVIKVSTNIEEKIGTESELNDDFLKDYAVYWEGYSFGSIGMRYDFKIDAAGAAQLYINKMLVINHLGDNNYEDIAYGNYTLTKGNMFIQVYYSHHVSNLGFLLEYKEGDKEKYISMSNIFYICPIYDGFVMQYPVVSYIKADVVLNTVVNADASISHKEMSVVPNLPNGIFVKEQRITGNANIDYLPLTNYDISIDKYNFPIYMTVRNSPLPAGLKLTNIIGNTVYEINTSVGKWVEYTLSVEKGDVKHYSVSNLPAGFSFDERSNKISGITREPMAGTAITVTAYSEYEYSSFNVLIKAESKCSERYSMLSFKFDSEEISISNLELILTSSEGDFKILGGATVQTPYETSGCYENGEYLVSVHGNGKFTITVFSNGYKLQKIDIGKGGYFNINTSIFI